MEQLKSAEPIFLHIEELIKQKNYQGVYNYIDSTEPPKDWVVELPSKIGKDKYKTIKLEVMEAVMNRIFGQCAITNISIPVINQDKSGRHSVTVTVTYQYKGFDNFYNSLHGIASVVVNDMNLLELATPKASSMALKNAIKQLGGLFGKYLNKLEDVESELPSSTDNITKEEQLQSITEGIVSAKNMQDLKSWRHVIYSKVSTPDVQELYETRLRQFTNNNNQNK